MTATSDISATSLAQLIYLDAEERQAVLANRTQVQLHTLLAQVSTEITRQRDRANFAIIQKHYALAQGYMNHVEHAAALSKAILRQIQDNDKKFAAA